MLNQSEDQLLQHHPCTLPKLAKPILADNEHEHYELVEESQQQTTIDDCLFGNGAISHPYYYKTY